MLFRKKKGYNLKVIRFFIKQHKLYFMFLVGLAILVGFLESLNVGLMYPLINNVLNIEASDNAFLNFIDPYVSILPAKDVLTRYSIAFMIVAVNVSILKAAYYYFLAKFMSKVVTEVKQDVFAKCIDSDYQFFVDNKQGEILYKTAYAPSSVTQLLQILADVFLHLFLSISVFIMLFAMSWKLVIMIIVLGVIYFYLIKQISTKISYKAGKKQRETGQKEQVIVTEYTRGIKQIKVFETFDYWKDMFDKTVDTFWFHHRRNFFWNKIPEILLWLVLYVAIGGSIIAIQVLYPGEGLRLLPLLGTFAAGLFIIMPRISRFGNLRMTFAHTIPNVEAVYELLTDKTYSKIQNGTKKFTGLKKCLSLRKVTFSHKQRDILLKDFNIEIKKDQTTALVGASGSGKSTIVDILLRLYDVENGGVYIDDVNIKDYDIFTIREKMGFVSQDTFIFNGSIRENIAFGTDYSDGEIQEAAKMANIDEFIKKLPEKYDTPVGDQGLMLSGGEKQRIAIARAIIRKPEILVLDEATSSLDNVSEKVVQKAIDKISKKCTTFIIAHRLSTIQNADTIHVVDNGEIVESGSHDELLKKKGKYWELYNIQNKM